MTREIKFRAWDKENQKMIEQEEGISGSRIIGSNGFINLVEFQVGSSEGFDPCNNFVFMQYTGLKDKNNAKIFEGDICNIKPRGKQWDTGYVKYSVKYGQYVLMVKYSYYGEEKKEHVIFCHNGSSTQSRPYNMHSFGNGIEVIGNIYQNPELIK